MLASCHECSARCGCASCQHNDTYVEDASMIIDASSYETHVLLVDHASNLRYAAMLLHNTQVLLSDSQT